MMYNALCRCSYDDKKNIPSSYSTSYIFITHHHTTLYIMDTRAHIQVDDSTITLVLQRCVLEEKGRHDIPVYSATTPTPGDGQKVSYTPDAHTLLNSASQSSVVADSHNTSVGILHATSTVELKNDSKCDNSIMWIERFVEMNNRYTQLTVVHRQLEDRCMRLEGQLNEYQNTIAVSNTRIQDMQSRIDTMQPAYDTWSRYRSNLQYVGTLGEQYVFDTLVHTFGRSMNIEQVSNHKNHGDILVSIPCARGPCRKIIIEVKSSVQEQSGAKIRSPPVSHVEQLRKSMVTNQAIVGILMEDKPVLPNGQVFQVNPEQTVIILSMFTTPGHIALAMLEAYRIIQLDIANDNKTEGVFFPSVDLDNMSRLNRLVWQKGLEHRIAAKQALAKAKVDASILHDLAQIENSDRIFPSQLLRELRLTGERNHEFMKTNSGTKKKRARQIQQSGAT